MSKITFPAFIFLNSEQKNDVVFLGGGGQFTTEAYSTLHIQQ